MNTDQLLQEVFILATGTAANSQNLKDLRGMINEATGDASVLIQTVNDVMLRFEADMGKPALVKAVALNGLGVALTDTDALAWANKLPSFGLNSWAEVFAWCITLTNDAGTTLDQRAQAANAFLDNLDSTQKTQFFNGAAVYGAVKNLLQNINFTSQSLSNATDGFKALAVSLSAQGIKSSVIDGYVRGATVFADANGDGILNAGEFSTTTDENGNYLLPPDVAAGTVYASGGVDIMTGRPFQGVLTAPVGATVVNPLTTLVQAMVSGGQAASVAEATAAVQQALGLPANINLLSYDPLVVLASGTASGAEQQAALVVQATALQIANVISQVANSIDASGSLTLQSSAATVITALANMVGSATTVLNLSSADTLGKVVQDAVTQSGISSLNTTQLSQISAVTASSNAAAAAATDIIQLSQAAVVSQGSATDALIAAAGSGNFGEAVSNFTGNTLLAAIDNATPGFIAPSVPVPAPAPAPEPPPADTTAPTVTLEYSVDGGTTYGTNLIVRDAHTVLVRATFSEAVTDGSPRISADAYAGPNGSTLEVLTSTAMTKIDATHYVFEFNVPSGDVVRAFMYFINGTPADQLKFAVSAASDTAGNVIATEPANPYLYVDNAAPTLTNNTAMTVEVNNGIHVQFNERIVSTGTGTFNLYETQNNTLVETFNLQTGVGDHGGTLTIDTVNNGKGATINPGADLVAGTGYHITIDSISLMDAAGNAFAGINSNTGLTVAAVADTAPLLVNSTPRDGTVFQFDHGVSLNFDESVKAGTGHITITNANDSTDTRVLDVTNAQNVAFSGSWVSLNLSAPLLVGGQYSVQVDASAITEMSGTAFAGISDNTTLNFTAVQDAIPPYMQSATVSADGLSLVITYTEALGGTLEVGDFSVNNGAYAVTAATIGAGSDANKLTLTLGTAVTQGASVEVLYDSTNGTANSLTDTATPANAAPTNGLSGAWVTNLSTAQAPADTTAPTATITSGFFDEAAGKLYLYGTNFDTLLSTGESMWTSDVKGRLDWSKLSWDIGGSTLGFALDDVEFATVGGSGLSIGLKPTKVQAVVTNPGYGQQNQLTDKLNVTAGFLKDEAGNAATTDALVNGDLYQVYTIRTDGSQSLYAPNVYSNAFDIDAPYVPSGTPGHSVQGNFAGQSVDATNVRSQSVAIRGNSGDLTLTNLNKEDMQVYTLFQDGSETTRGSVNVTASGSGVSRFSTGSGNDNLSSSYGNGVFFLSGGGSDTLTGGSGDDSFGFAFAEFGNDTINGNTGNDRLWFSDAAQLVDTHFANISDLEGIILADIAGNSVTLGVQASMGLSSVQWIGMSGNVATHGITVNAATFTKDLSISTGSGNDDITGGSGDDGFFLHSGQDTVHFAATSAQNGSDYIKVESATNLTLDFTAFLGTVTANRTATNLANGLDLTSANVGFVYDSSNGSLFNALSTTAGAGKVALQDNAKAVLFWSAAADASTPATFWQAYYVEDTNAATDAQTWTVFMVGQLQIGANGATATEMSTMGLTTGIL